MMLETLFDIGDWVHIDGDESIRAYVAAVTIRGRCEHYTYECKWLNNGAPAEDWIEEPRLSAA